MILTEETLARYRANQGYVYLVHAVETDRYKIGRSVNPVARLLQLKGQSPYPLQIIECFWLPDAVEDEKGLHERFAHHRVYGEWFKFEGTGKIGSFLNLVCREFEFFRPVVTELYKEAWKIALLTIYSGTPHIERINRALSYEANDVSLYKSDCYYFLVHFDSSLSSLFHKARNLEQLEKIINFTTAIIPYSLTHLHSWHEIEAIGSSAILWDALEAVIGVCRYQLFGEEA